MMTIHKLAQNFEMKFWDIVTPFMADEGPIMKTINVINGVIKSRAGYLALLIFVWAGVGFVSGLILGRLFWMIQIV